MATFYGKRMVASMPLFFLLVALLPIDSCMGDNWKKHSETDPTCHQGDQVGKARFGISLEKCQEIASSMKNVNFIWYAPKKMQWQDRQVCAFYKKCELGKRARYPARPGATYERKATGSGKN